MRDPLVLPALALAAGIVVARFAPFSLTELVSALVGFLALALLAARKASRLTRNVCILLACAALGTTVAVWRRPFPPPELDAEAGETLIVEGCVIEPPVFFEGREQFVVELEPGARARVSLYLKEDQKPPDLRYGQRVEVEARVRPPRNFGNPGSFDSTGYLARRHIFWVASARTGAEVKVIGEGCGSKALAAIYSLRTAALRRIDSLFGEDTYTANMMRAILLGDSSKLQKVWTENFRRTGTYHALVISGLHVTVLAAVLIFALRVLAAPELVALAITVFAAWLYALLAGGSPPVVRAAAGLTLYTVGRYCYRQCRILNLLAVVAIVFLLVDPEQLFEASFQLSFLSVAAIGALAVPLLEARSAPMARGLKGLAESGRDARMDARVAQFRVELRLLAETVSLWLRVPFRAALFGLSLCLRAVFFFWELLAVSAVVQLALALPMILYFHRLSLSGLSANQIIVPLLSMVVPLGFVAIVTGWTLPASLAAWMLDAARAVADWHIRWEPDLRIPDPPLWLALLFVAAIAALAFSIRKAHWSRWPSLGVSLALAATIVIHPFAPAIERGILELTAVDVGQGDSLFLAFPDGRTLVIDGGGFPTFGRQSKPRLDLGEDVVSPYLWSRSIRRVDVVALSHAHEDHLGGLRALIDNYRPREFWVSTNAAAYEPWTTLRDHAIARGVKVVTLSAGSQFDFGGTNIQVLSPDAASTGTPHNNDSLVFRITYGARSLLLTGDAERPVESHLLAEGSLLKADVLKVGHHGSRTSTTPSFLEAVHPALAVISAGIGNVYRHPHPDVVARLQQSGVRVFRTDQTGLVTIRTDGWRLQADTMAWTGELRRKYEAF